MKTTYLALLALLSVGLAACGGETADASASASPGATARPKPTPTTDRTQVDNYTRVVDQDSNRISRSMSTMGTACSNLDVLGCRAAMEKVASESERYLRDLDMNPAPPCIDAADVELRAALKDYRDGSRRGAQGIDTNDPSLVTQGADTVSLGTAHMNRASNLIRSANC